MNRQLRRVLALAGVAAFPALAALTPLAACAADDGPPACVALANCCYAPDNDDPTSCIETAQSGELSDASCGTELAMYVAMGECLADGGIPPMPDAGATSQ